MTKVFLMGRKARMIKVFLMGCKATMIRVFLMGRKALKLMGSIQSEYCSFITV